MTGQQVQHRIAVQLTYIAYGCDVNTRKYVSSYQYISTRNVHKSAMSKATYSSKPTVKATAFEPLFLASCNSEVKKIKHNKAH
jgi:hypothetical protein